MHPFDDLQSRVARRTACPVGAGDIARLEFEQLFEMSKQLLFANCGLGREQLEGQAKFARSVGGSDLHMRVCSSKVRLGAMGQWSLPARFKIATKDRAYFQYTSPAAGAHRRAYGYNARSGRAVASEPPTEGRFSYSDSGSSDNASPVAVRSCCV